MLPGRRADNGSIFVVQGPAPVGALMEGGIAVTPLGAIYISELATSFSPIDLFQNNEQGAWYDPSDLSTMFQDSAGTTPVTAVGQSVGLILDKSGNNNHATQATAARRPVLQIDGNGKYYLGFDGVDDSLKSSIFSSNITTPTITIGIALTAYGINKYLYDGSTTDSMELYQSDASGSVAMYAGGLGSTSTGPLTLSTPYVTTNQFNLTSGKLRLNGVGETVSTGYVNTNAIALSSNGAQSIRTAQRIYALICRGALSTTQEITDTETWVAAKTGVTLP